MKVAVAGTPGVGKTAACALVKSLPVKNVNDLAAEYNAVKGYDRRRRTKEVDVRRLARAVKQLEGDVIVEGHFSHCLGVDLAIVLRCSPRVLAKRLEAKGWSAGKVRENVEAEAVDVVLVEAVEIVPEVCEIDTTRRTPLGVARAIDAICRGEREKYPVGNVDWSREVLSWF